MHIADMLSRACLEGKPSVCALQLQDVEPTDELSVSPERLEVIKSATASDPVLQNLCEVVKHGWPHERSTLKPELYPYFHIRDEITVQNGLLFKANRVARDNVYWPRMNQEVRDYVSKCASCCAHRPEQGQEPMLPHEVPDRPWNKVAVDLLQLRNKDFLITVDYYSGFYEVQSIQTTRASAVIQVLKSQFARHGIPQTVVSDNGPQFACDEFKTFAAAWEFHHVTSSPHKSNGRAEAAVKACKSLIKKTEESGEDVQLVLLAARNTPVERLDASPVQLLFGRRTRSLLPQHCSLLQPSTPKNIAPKRSKIKRKQKWYYLQAKPS
ncbi:uncharacterized protein K02A2.6-like [Acropora millepora]|uniref:uncharacterized protein K02A2.6-like n=1 Tax=Acropora millepora TaxID=45264 RepID=UPI001CF42950|nr:uncharacterized protein K02A2.6-like [Acropora millepora]